MICIQKSNNPPRYQMTNGYPQRRYIDVRGKWLNGIKYPT